MSNKIFEAQTGSGPHRGHAAGDTDIEKKVPNLFLIQNIKLNKV